MISIPDHKEWNYDFYEHEEEIKEYPNLKKIVIIGNLPITSQKINILGNLLKKKIKAIVPSIERDDISIPIDKESGRTVGIAFIKFKSENDALESLQFKRKLGKDKSSRYLTADLLDDYNHIINFNIDLKEFMEDINNIKSVSSVYKPLYSHLEDDSYRDQFLIHEHKLLHVYWNYPLRVDILCRSNYVNEKSNMAILKDENILKIETKEDMASSNAYWSPFGTYLTIISKSKFIVLYGGRVLKEVMRFEFDRVYSFKFSNSESYLVTQCFDEDENQKSPMKKSLKIHSLLSQQTIYNFPLNNNFANSHIKWSYNDQYFAYKTLDSLHIYETLSSNLVKTIKNFVSTFEWSPKNLLLTFIIPGKDTKESTLEIMSIPDIKIISHRTYYDVTTLSIYWHSTGRFLISSIRQIKIIRKSKDLKKKKKLCPFFDVFFVLEKDVPISRFEFEREKRIRKIKYFEFDPINDRFAIVFISVNNNLRTRLVGLYEITDKIREITILKNEPANSIYWSPSGKHLLMAGLPKYEKNKSLYGNLNFYNCDYYLSITKNKHKNCSYVKWSPCGRYVVTFDHSPLIMTNYGNSNNKYMVWTTNGELLIENSYSNLYSFSWRPRPKIIEDKKKEIKFDMDLYINDFEAEDKKNIQMTMDKKANEQFKMLEKFNEVMNKVNKLRSENKKERKKILKGLNYGKIKIEQKIERVNVEEEIEVIEEVIEEGN